MKRICVFLGLSALACSALFAAKRPEMATYTEGNVSSVTPGTGGALVFSDETSMTFRAGSTDVAVPYQQMVTASLGDVQEQSQKEALYKVWALHKRFYKSETQSLAVDYRDSSGELKSMTFELSKPAAESVLETIQAHNSHLAARASHDAETASAKPAGLKAVQPSPPMLAQEPVNDDWWGDRVWKTTRNAAKWDGKSSVAPR